MAEVRMVKMVDDERVLEGEAADIVRDMMTLAFFEGTVEDFADHMEQQAPMIGEVDRDGDVAEALLDAMLEAGVAVLADDGPSKWHQPEDAAMMERDREDRESDKLMEVSCD